MPAPAPRAPLSRRRFLATVGLAAAGGASATLAAVALSDRRASAQPVASAAAFADQGATPGPSPAVASQPVPSPDFSAFRSHYRSRPDLTPPQVLVQVPAGPVAGGLIFYTPANGSGSDGPAIVDNSGELVWLRPDSGAQVANLQVIVYAGRPALAWWEGKLNGGIGSGEIVLVDGTYREVARVRAGNGRLADLHEFQVTDRGTALLFADAGVPATRAPSGTVPAGGGQVMDCAVQEIDLGTGAVRFEWHAVDHIALDESFVAPTTDPNAIYDYVHANSIAVDHDGNLLISARNTSAIYKVNRTTGAVIWRLGGKRSDFAIGAGAAFSWQHDARRQADGALTLFDDGASPGHSRAIALRLDEQAMTATLLRAFEHPRKLLARSQGNMQILPDGNVFVGWGDTAYVSEFSAAGTLVFDATYPAAAQSYRDIRAEWTGNPADSPAVAAVAGPDGAVTAFASWNGATRVASWEVLAGPARDRLTQAGSAARAGFETSIPVHGPAAFAQVRALDAAGTALGSSAVVGVSA